MFNIENLVINRPLRGTMFEKATGDVIFSIDKIADLQLECSGEQVFTNDHLGQKLAAFDRSKDAKLTGSNAIFNFGMLAAQLGSDKEVATSEKKIITPAFDLIDVVDDSGKVSLTHKPFGEVKYIYSTHPDKSRDQKYTLSTAASETEFAISGKEITLPTGKFKKGDRVVCWYEREVEDAVKIANTTDKFAKGGRFVLEALCADVCDTNKEYYTYIIFNNSKMDNAVTMAFSNEAKQNFTINALQDYCSTNNELFTIIVAGDN